MTFPCSTNNKNQAVNLSSLDHNSRSRYQSIHRLLAQSFFFFIIFFFVLSAVANSVITINAETIRQQLENDAGKKQNKTGMATLRRFYAQRNYEPIWIKTENHPAASLDMALAFIARAGAEGLADQDYDADYLLRLRNKYGEQISLELELHTTRCLLVLARDLRNGRLMPSAADPDWHITQQDFDPVSFLQQAVANNDLESALTELSPDIPQYRALKQLLTKLRELEASDVQWTHIPETTPSLRPNTTHPAVVLIRQRMQEAYVLFENPTYALTDNISEFYDAPLVNAVKAFQRQYNLNADGVIGKNTRQALNKTLHEHIQQVRINLERLRWLPRKLDDRYILVNIAGFRLVAVENKERVLDMRIVVGRNYRSTPSFNSRITHIVLNPYWNVPRSIASKDLLPKQRQNPDYFASQGIRVFSDYRYQHELDASEVDWYTDDQPFPYVLRQDPGRRNALGTIKFMFPNPFSIYLHDTPSKSLFKRDIRTYSSGCIRLEKPMELAEFVLEQSFFDNNIAGKIGGGRTHTINLPEQLPVYLVYLTAWSDSQGVVYFASDIYGRDKRALDYAHWQ